MNPINLRTDIAIERHEMLRKSRCKGVSVSKKKINDIGIDIVEIEDERAACLMKKPVGKYITLELPQFSHESELLDDRLTVLTDLISDLLPPGAKSFLVAGLGNENITPDALGPLCAGKIFSTRHFEKLAMKKLGLPPLNPVSAISTGVLGQTGIETAEYIGSIVRTIKPDAVIIVDALASSKLSSLGKTVQLSDNGITPGSGVGNFRKPIDKETLGVPVISLGVPTVVDGNHFDHSAEKMMVTPREVDTIVSRAAALLALAINCALQPEAEPDMFLALS